jgi:hypothetical protein
MFRRLTLEPRIPRARLRDAPQGRADVDAVADMYGGGCTTLGLVATSIHPMVAGVLHAVIDVLLAHGARIDAPGSGRAYPLVNGCLANGRDDAAEYLANRGAPLDLEGAAGVGRLDIVKSFFKPDGSLKETATLAQMRDGFTWACEYGRTDVVEYLLDRGINVDKLFPCPFTKRLIADNRILCRTCRTPTRTFGLCRRS